MALIITNIASISLLAAVYLEVLRHDAFSKKFAAAIVAYEVLVGAGMRFQMVAQGASVIKLPIANFASQIRLPGVFLKVHQVFTVA